MVFNGDELTSSPVGTKLCFSPTGIACLDSFQVFNRIRIQVNTRLSKSFPNHGNNLGFREVFRQIYIFDTVNPTNKLLYSLFLRMVSNVNYQVQFRKTSCYRDSYGIFRVCNDLYSILTSIVDDSQLRKQISTISSDLPIRHPYLTYPLKLFSYAKWTDTSIGTCIDDGLIVITTFVAVPPDIGTVLISNCFRREVCILVGPLSHQRGMSCSKVIIPFPYSLTGTIWTTMAFSSISYASFPFMVLITDPENGFV